MTGRELFTIGEYTYDDVEEEEGGTAFVRDKAEQEMDDSVRFQLSDNNPFFLGGQGIRDRRENVLEFRRRWTDD